MGKHRCEEWCGHQRKKCDKLVGWGTGTVTFCGAPAVWRAAPNSPLFPLAYCAEHEREARPATLEERTEDA